MLRHLARRLLALLILLALIAGGQSPGVMALSMDAIDMGKMQAGDMDQGCEACGAPIAAPCDIVCAALPALDVAAFRVDPPGLHERWSNHPQSGISIFITPDTSPPRA